MGTFTVEQVIGRKEWEGQHGPMVDYKLMLVGEAEEVQLTQKPASPAPAPGTVLNGEIVAQNQNGYAYRKFKKEQQQGGGGGRGRREYSPEEQRLILIQGRQNQAVNLAVALIAQGHGSENTDWLQWITAKAETLADHCTAYVEKAS